MEEFEIRVGAENAPSPEEMTTRVRGFSAKEMGLPGREKILELVQSKQEDHLGPASGVDPQLLQSSGWGVLFAADEKPEIIEALRPLLEWRKEQAGKLYVEYSGEKGYRPGLTKDDFLKDAGGFGVVNPKTNGIPYYLLFVGSPKQIPYSFQYLVDVQYAVGRIHFDKPSEYRMYAENVVAAEKKKLARKREAAFYGTANAVDDSPTRQSRSELIEPLAEFVSKGTERHDKNGEVVEKIAWTAKCPPASEVTKAGLVELVRNPPALVMVASHGMDLSKATGDAAERNRKRFNGSLLSQDHVFVKGDKAPPPKFESFLTFEDVPKEAKLHGSIFLIFACFGGGTPEIEDFIDGGGSGRRLAEESFLAALPKRLLTGGALAVIAHVERVWTTSFKTKHGLTQLQTFEHTFNELMLGSPVGFAMESFNTKWAELSTTLVTEIRNERNRGNLNADNGPLRNLWEAMYDARNFCVIGDPAVRPMVGDEENFPVEIERNPMSDEIMKEPVAAVAEVKGGEAKPEAFEITSMNLSGRGTEQASASGGTLEGLVARIGATMESVVKGLTTVEVETYVSDNVANVEFKDNAFVGAKLRAKTLFGIDGKMVNLVPEKDGKLDEALWAVHLASVDKAVANRSEMIKLAANAASSLLAVVKGK